MSRRLKQLSGRAVAAALTTFGFDVVATRGVHCKMRRTLPSGERQTMTIPLHSSLAPGTLHAIYRQASRFVPETELYPHFYSGEPATRGSEAERPRGIVDGQRPETKRRQRNPRRAKR